MTDDECWNIDMDELKKRLLLLCHLIMLLYSHIKPNIIMELNNNLF